MMLYSITKLLSECLVKLLKKWNRKSVNIFDSGMSGQCYIRVKGINFGLIEDNPNQEYAIQVYNPVTKNKTKFYVFHYKNQRNFSIVFSIELANIKSQTFTIYLYKQYSIFHSLLGELVIPISAFPENAVCVETLELSMNKYKDMPISMNIDVHVDTNGAKMFSAPPGESKLQYFDIEQYRNRVAIKDDFTPKGIKASASQPLVLAGYF